LFKASREASLIIVKRLTPELLNNSGIHSQSGEYSINKWMTSYTNHPQDHARQLLAD
jgi:hypothetical protein